MYVHFDLPEAPPRPNTFGMYWLRATFIGSPSTRYEINVLASTYVRLVDAALIEYEEGCKRLREFWSTHDSFNLGAMHRSISHFESCIFNMNRAINCFRRLRGDRLHDPIAQSLRRQRFAFSNDDVADRIREVRNEIHHLEESVLSGQIAEGQNSALRPVGPEVPHPTEEGQTIMTIDHLVIGSNQVTFRELVQWLGEMTEAVANIVENLPNTSPPASGTNAA